MIRQIARCIIFLGLFFNTTGVSAASLQELAIQYAPIFQLQHQETFLPSSVEWYINRVELQYKKSSVVPAGSLHPQLLAHWQPSMGQNLTNTEKADHLALKIPDQHRDEIRAGDLSSASCYTHPHYIDQGRGIEINYVIFFPFNGQAFTKSSLINRIFYHYGVGFHEGDFEHITIRLNAEGSKILGVYYSAHSDEETWLTKDFPVTPENRLISYVALNTHAMYPYSGIIHRRVLTPEWFYKYFHIRKSWTPLIDITDNKGPILDCRQQMTLIESERSENHPWTEFLGRWGSRSSEYYSSTGPGTFTHSSWFINREEIPTASSLRLKKLAIKPEHPLFDDEEEFKK